jgi:hypothetical protein
VAAWRAEASESQDLIWAVFSLVDQLSDYRGAVGGVAQHGSFTFEGESAPRASQHGIFNQVVLNRSFSINIHLAAYNSDIVGVRPTGGGRATSRVGGRLTGRRAPRLQETSRVGGRLTGRRAPRLQEAHYAWMLPQALEERSSGGGAGGEWNSGRSL